MTKKLFLMAIVVIVFFIVQDASATDSQKSTVINGLTFYTTAVATGGTVATGMATSGTLYSQPVNMGRSGHKCSFQFKTNGSGTVNIDYLISNDNVVWVVPTYVTATSGSQTIPDLLTGVTTTSNTAEGYTGEVFVNFVPPPCKSIMIRLIEQGVEYITPTKAILAVQ